MNIIFSDSFYQQQINILIEIDISIQLYIFLILGCLKWCLMFCRAGGGWYNNNDWYINYQSSTMINHLKGIILFLIGSSNNIYSCPPLTWLVSAPNRSHPGLFSLDSSHIWRWWLGPCYTRRGMPPCYGVASPFRPAPLSVPSPCSHWSTRIKCLLELRSVWITAVSSSERCNVFYFILFIAAPFHSICEMTV